MADVNINWFEIPVANLQRAADFYSEVMQITLGEMESPAGPIRTFRNGDMPIGALVQSEHNAPAQTGAILYFNSPDIDATLARVQTAGGEVSMPGTSIGEHGRIAQFLDTEGNRVALHSH